MKMDLERFPKSETAKKLMEYVTAGWYETAYVGKWMFQVEGAAMDQVQKVFEEYQHQALWMTATWGLRYHEIKYGLSVREDLSYEERRRRIRARQVEREPQTPYHIGRLINSRFPGYEVDVADVNDSIKAPVPIPHPNVFVVVFHGAYDINVLYLMQVLDRYKQSHTTYLLYDVMNYEDTYRLHAGAVTVCYIRQSVVDFYQAQSADCFSERMVGRASSAWIRQSITDSGSREEYMSLETGAGLASVASRVQVITEG